MRYGILADVHGNLPALDAAIRVLERERVDRFLCLGDLVGYGASPNECARRVRELDALCVAGNHDLIAIGRLDDSGIGPLARQTLGWTAGVLAEDVREQLAALPLLAFPEDGIAMAHGAPGDPRRYVRTRAQAEEALTRLTEEHPAARVLLVGHTHVAAIHERGAAKDLRARRVARLPPRSAVLLNPGAVGQSRQASPHGRVLVLDNGERTARWHVVRYDRAAARRALARAGLPVSAHHINPYAARTLAGRVRSLALRR
jgi:predicted phosphodiesterase